MGPIKILNKSITFKLFLLMFTFTLLIVGLIVTWIIRDTNQMTKKEMYEMRNQVLSEISNNISILLSNVETIGNNIVVDSELTDILDVPKEELPKDKESKKKMDSYVEGLLNDEVWKYGEFNMKPELYVIGENGLTYSTYSKTKYDIDKIKSEDWYNKIIEADGDTVLINTYKDENGIGPYKNIFKMGRLIKDLITEETLGVLIIDISETMLYDRYAEALKSGSDIYIIDSQGKIISSKDKRDIGMNYEEVKEGLERKNNTQNIEITSKINRYGWSIVQEVPSSILTQLSTQIAQRILLILAVVSLLALLIAYKLSVLITKPIFNIKNKMDEVMEGNLKVQVEVENDDEIGQLGKSFNSMVNWLDSSIIEIKQQEEQKRIAELSFLQAQINPHFLYNTLSGIRFLISMNKTEEAEEMLYRFTKLLRSILPKASEMISLEEEMNNIENYVELQKMRHPNCFDVSYDIDPSINEFDVPSFILQPIVENAILYSMEKEHNKGVISITGYRSKDGIRIIIEDNGIGMTQNQVKAVLKKEESMNRVGVINVHERLQLNYGEEYGLKIESIESKGTKVIFILPS